MSRRASGHCPRFRLAPPCRSSGFLAAPAVEKVPDRGGARDPDPIAAQFTHVNNSTMAQYFAELLRMEIQFRPWHRQAVHAHCFCSDARGTMHAVRGIECSLSHAPRKTRASGCPSTCAARLRRAPTPMTIFRQLPVARLTFGATAVMFVLLAGCASPQQPPDVVASKTGWMRSEVADSYLYAYPLVMMEVARQAATDPGAAGPGQAPVNTLRIDASLPPAGAVNPPLPGIDTLDASGWLDVGTEPLILSLPDTRGRYLDARVLGMWTNVVWSTGAEANPRNGSSRAQTIVLVGPGFQGTLPAGVKRVDLPARHAWLGVRVRSGGAGRELAEARRWQRAVRLVPLSAWSARPARGATATAGAGADADNAAATSASVAAHVAALDAKTFFSRFAEALPDNPPPQPDPHVDQVLDEIGVKAGVDPDWSGERLAAAARGVEDARARLTTPPSKPVRGGRLALARRRCRLLRGGLHAARLCGDDAFRRRHARRRHGGDRRRRRRWRGAERRPPLRAAFRGARAAAGTHVLVADALYGGRRAARAGPWPAVRSAASTACSATVAVRSISSCRPARRAALARPTGCRRRAPISSWRCASMRPSPRRPTAPGSRRRWCASK